jgi:hypothetical protein
MVLVHPKKGIYKDGHERSDTVAYRKLYIAELNTFKSREQSYTGDQLEIPVTPADTSSAEIVRVYHDECIYASHEGAIQCWVPEGTDGKYKKPRGEIVMASGFICRCHFNSSFITPFPSGTLPTLKIALVVHLNPLGATG